jgi:hypothetical protein
MGRRGRVTTREVRVVGVRHQQFPATATQNL